MVQDLVILAADKQMEFALNAALARPDAIGIRPVSLQFRVHSDRDAGVRTTGAAMLALERARFNHALLVLDFEGSGASESNAVELEARLQEQLRMHWGDSACAIVIEPELDVWVWGSDNALHQVLGWRNEESIRRWLEARDFAMSEQGKPLRPKEALEEVLRECRTPRSAAIYHKIISRISIGKCVDPAATRLASVLRHWFGLK